MATGRSARDGCRVDDDAVSTIVALLVAAAVFASVFSVAFVLAKNDQTAVGNAVSWKGAAENLLASLTESPGEAPTWSSCATAARVGLLDPGRSLRLLSPAKLDALRGTDPATKCASFDSFKLKTGVTVSDASGNALPFDLGSVHARVRLEPSYFPFPNGTTAELKGVRTAYVGVNAGTGGATSWSSATKVELGLLKESGVAMVNSTSSLSHLTHKGSGGDVFNDTADDLVRKLSLRLAGFEGATNSTGIPPAEPSGWKVIEKGFYGRSVCSNGANPPKCHEWWTSASNGCGNDNNAQMPRRVVTPGVLRENGGCKFEYDARVFDLVVGEFDLRAYARDDFTAQIDVTGWFSPTRAVLTANGAQVAADRVSVYAACIANCTLESTTGQELWGTTVSYGQKPGIGGNPGVITRTVALDNGAGATDWKFTGTKFVVFLRLDGTLTALSGLPACGVGGALCSLEKGQGWFVTRATLRVEDSNPVATVKTVYDNALDYRTTKYDLVVVGSNVRQALALEGSRQIDSVPRAALLSWVQAGGRLVVLGSPTVSNTWLADAENPAIAATPLFTVASGVPQAVSGLRADASDTSHPIVTSPHVLSHVLMPRSPAYAIDDGGTPPTYYVPYAPSSTMTKVLVGQVTGCSGATCPSLLAVSNPSSSAVAGGYDGFVVLTSMRPALMGADPSRQEVDAEAWRTLVDVLAYASRHEANLDWGESVPTGSPFGYASVTTALARQSGAAPWPVTVTTFVWD